MSNPNQNAASSANVSYGNNSQNDWQATSAMMTSMAECLAIQNSTLNIPHFDGKNIPLKSFVQDIQNNSALVSPVLEGSFLKAVIAKLQGSARDSTYGKTFNSINDLIKHLKSRFAPGKNYPYYQHEIENIRMKRGESVNDFYDRLNILISGAQVALEDTYGNGSEHMILPLKECALEAFFRGLPDEIARSVDVRDPKDLEEALKFAVRIESRMKSGIVPTGETQRGSFSSSDRYPREYPSNQQQYTRFENPNSSNFANYSVRNQMENRSRSPSPSYNASKTPTGILKPPQQKFPYDHSEHLPNVPYPYFTPYYYPPMPYSPYYPHPNIPYFPNSQTSGIRSPRSSSPTHSLVRPSSPSINKDESKHLKSDHLNSQSTRRADATTSFPKKERQTVKFLEPQNE